MRIAKAEPYLYVLPALLILLAFIAYPVVQSFRYALYDWDGLGAPAFIGLANFRKVAVDPIFWRSLKNTVIWVVLSGMVLSISGLFLAFLVEYGASARFFSGVARTVLFMPMMMSLVAIGLLWSLIYNPMLGLLTNLLSAVGLADKNNPIDLLGNPRIALYFTFVPAIWQWSGFGMGVFSAALQEIPKDLFDASAIDGADYTQQLRHITLPLLYPSVVVVTTVNIIGAFKAFDLSYVMTAGGPGEATLVSSILVLLCAAVSFAAGTKEGTTAAQGKTVVTFWTYKLNDPVTAVVNQFNTKYPAYTLNLSEYESEDLKTQVRVAVAGGKAPICSSPTRGSHSGSM